MGRTLSRVLLAAAVLAAVNAGQALATQAGTDRAPSFRVVIPSDVDPNGLYVRYGRCRDGLCNEMSSLSIEKGKRECSIPILWATEMRAYAYCPGYQIAWVVEPNLAVPWTPQFKRAQTVTLTGKLTDSKGKPVANETLRFSYFMNEHLEFFNLQAGGITGPTILGEAVTAQDGSFRIEVADMARDPFVMAFSKWKVRDHGLGGVRREIHIDLWPPKGIRAEGRWKLDPDRIPMSPKYDTPIAIKVLERGRLYGRMSDQVRSEKGIDGPVSLSASGVEKEGSFWLDAEPIGPLAAASSEPHYSSYNCRLKEDLTFDVRLPPGKYNLVIVQGYYDHTSGHPRFATRRQVVATDVVIADGEDTKIIVK